MKIKQELSQILKQRANRHLNWCSEQYEKGRDNFSVLYHDGFGNVYAQCDVPPICTPYSNSWIKLADRKTGDLVHWNCLGIKFKSIPHFTDYFHGRVFIILSCIRRDWDMPVVMGGRSLLYISRSRRGHHGLLFARPDRSTISNLLLPYTIS